MKHLEAVPRLPLRHPTLLIAAIAALAMVPGLLFAVQADAAFYVRERPSDNSRFMFRTFGKAVTGMNLTSPRTCGDGNRGTITVRQGVYQPDFRLPVAGNGQFAYTDKPNSQSSFTVKLRAKISGNWVRGKWFARWYDDDDRTWCWTGKRARNPWVSVGALRKGPPREAGRG